MKGVWVRPASGRRAVVFIHGVLSDGEGCWHHDNGTYWPTLLSHEKELESVGIYVFTYKTGIFSGTFRLGNVVSSLKEHMRLDGVLSEDNDIVFVCHSMGGIVARKFLVQQTVDLIQRKIAIGLFLIASPSRGSKYADWLAPIARFFKHSHADALRFSETNSWLADLDEEFQSLTHEGKLPLSGKELIEDKFIALSAVLHRQVVEPISGARYFPDPYKVPNSDHFTICKVGSADDIQHRLLRQFIFDFFKAQEASRGVANEVAGAATRLEPEGAPTSSRIARSSSTCLAATGCLVDLQSAHGPQQYTRLSEIRFTITNSTAGHIKVTSIELKVLRATPFTRTASIATAAPVDEYSMFTDIDSKTTAAELLSRTHVLASSETDGFFLKVNAAEGFCYEASITVTWNPIPNGESETASSPIFTLAHPVYSVSGLLRLADSQPPTGRG
ncbi:esterase/lipase family protein [Lichenifustis flavocetrariae]|uniref:AB hydrolase-1 domain-containing protein n=1 Tax=Lichenifustis flavocetrariae TaxID=2949735 RepID=A0AA41Z2K1_9HYPH|nr:alpha/beta fold hydrolase [Lichenifustis flavocetrariae]MCW6511698.1 hypothetical protein [Lichenifustis flavocetrariae]